MTASMTQSHRELFCISAFSRQKFHLRQCSKRRVSHCLKFASDHIGSQICYATWASVRLKSKWRGAQKFGWPPPLRLAIFRKGNAQSPFAAGSAARGKERPKIQTTAD